MIARLRRLLNLPFAMQVSLATRLSLIALSFLTAVVAARLYGPVANGQIGLITAILAISSVVSLGGCQMLALRRLSGEVEDRSTLFTALLVRVLIGTLVVGLALALVVVPLFAETYVAALGAPLVWLLPLVAAGNALRIFLFETIRSREAILRYNLLLIVAPLAIFAALPILPRMIPGPSFAWLVVLAEALALVAAFAMIVQNGKGLRLVPIRLADLKVGAGPYFVSTLAVAAYMQDIFVVGTLVPTEQLGIYVIAARLGGLVGLPKTTAGIAYAPEVSRIYRADGLDAAIAHTRANTRALVPLALALALLIIAAGPYVLDFLGPQFRAAYPVMVLLVVAHLMLALTGHSGILMMMVGHERLQQLNFALSAAVMIGLIVFLVPDHGIIGGGIAVLAGATVRAVFGTVAIQLLLGTGITAWHVYFARPPADGDAGA